MLTSDMDIPEIEVLRRELRSIHGALKKTNDKISPPHVKFVSAKVANFQASRDRRPEEAYEEQAREHAIERIHKEVEERGVEALAWYSSFHRILPSGEPTKWGIFIKESSLYYLSDRLLDDADGGPESLHCSFQALLAHELFHYWTDLEVARLELITKRPLWRFDRWVRARTESFTGPKNIYWNFEEQAANASMIRQLIESEIPIPENSLKRFIETQPPGYRDAYESISDPQFSELCLELIRLKLGALGWSENRRLFSRVFSALSLRWFDGEIRFPAPPLYLVLDANEAARRNIDLNEGLIERIEITLESRRFEKQFKRLHPDHQKQWRKKKEMLSRGVPGHPEFEKMAGIDGLYSVRINSNHRAHLRWLKTDGIWIAEEIGSHSQMGHD